MKRLASMLAWAVVVACSSIGVAGRAPQQVIQGPQVEDFLRQAKIVGMKDIGKGVTIPRKATLDLNGTTGYAVFKTIDEKPEHPVNPGGDLEPEFQDSWRTEVAAYEMDKLIGLGMVPATVERTYENTPGSLQFWIDSKMDEATRVKQCRALHESRLRVPQSGH